MATNETIRLRVSSNSRNIPLELQDGNPYYVGARAYVTQTESGAVITVIDKDGTTTAIVNNGADGADGNGIASIEKTDTSGVVDTYTITFDNGLTTEFTVTNGEAGADGEDGVDGLGIASIARTGTSGLVDTYTITYSDGTTSTYTVTNGQDGVDGVDGVDGEDGMGIASISKTSTSGLVDTYTITYTDGTTSTFTVTNGQDGTDGQDGDDGADGFSPTATVVKVGDTATITITDKNGTTTASISEFSGSYDDLTDKPTIPAKNTWYGYSSSDANTNPKIVTTTSGDFVLEAGNIVYVDFDNINNVTDTTISIDGTTTKPLQSSSFSGSYSAANKWRGGEVVGMVYNGTKFVLLEQGIANTSIYGITKLNSSTSSTSTTEAATPSAVKAAYDHGGVTSVNGSTGDVTVNDVYYAEYNDDTYSNVRAAYNAGKKVVAFYADGVQSEYIDLIWFNSEEEVFFFSKVSEYTEIQATLNAQDVWTSTTKLYASASSNISSFTNDAGYLTLSTLPIYNGGVS